MFFKRINSQDKKGDYAGRLNLNSNIFVKEQS